VESAPSNGEVVVDGGANLMHIMEEHAQRSLEIIEVILADQQLEPDNR
jgi:hypothetical protein